MRQPAPRFQKGDRVRVIRSGPHADRVGIVREVDCSRLLAHYVVEFSNFYERVFPEFDLERAPTNSEHVTT